MLILTMTILIALFTHDFVDGMTRTCFYESPLGTHAITIGSAEICPLSIRVR